MRSQGLAIKPPPRRLLRMSREKGSKIPIGSSIFDEKDMLDDAKTIVETGKKMFSETIDPVKLRASIRDLQANPYLMKFFDDGTGDGTAPMIEALQNYNLYTTALAGQSDVGGMIAAGELANKTSEGIFSAKVILETGLSILKHDIVARLLSKRFKLLVRSCGIETPKYQSFEYKLNPNVASGTVSTITSPCVNGSFGFDTFHPFLSILN